jgi:hypothetical protein
MTVSTLDTKVLFGVLFCGALRREQCSNIGLIDRCAISWRTSNSRWLNGSIKDWTAGRSDVASRCSSASNRPLRDNGTKKHRKKMERPEKRIDEDLFNQKGYCFPDR